MFLNFHRQEESSEVAQRGTTKEIINYSLLIINYLVSSYIFPFHKIHEGPVANAVATGSGIISGKVPVALVIGAGFMKCFNCLENYFYRNMYIIGGD